MNGGGCTSRLHHAAQVEISNLDPPMTLHQHVGGLEVTVQNGRLVRVQMQHTLQQNGGLQQYASRAYAADLGFALHAASQ